MFASQDCALAVVAVVAVGVIGIGHCVGCKKLSMIALLEAKAKTEVKAIRRASHASDIAPVAPSDGTARESFLAAAK
jgi:hypothetical protein